MWLGPSRSQRQETGCLVWTGLSVCGRAREAVGLEACVAKDLCEGWGGWRGKRRFYLAMSF